MSGRLMGGVTPLIWAVLVGGTAASAPLMGWRGAFLLFGVVGVLWAVAFSLWFRDRPEDHPHANAAERALIGSERPPDAGHVNVPWRAIFTSRNLWALCIMYFAINYAWAFNMTYLPSYLQERFGVTEGDRVGAIYKGAPLWVGAAGCFLGGVVVNALARLLGDRRRGAPGAGRHGDVAGGGLLVGGGPRREHPPVQHPDLAGRLRRRPDAGRGVGDLPGSRPCGTSRSRPPA